LRKEERISIRQIALYAPAAHRPLATRFGEDQRVVSLFFRSRALWVLGYSESALADTDHALEDARESPISAFLALAGAFYINCFCGNYTIANAQVDELVALADEKNTPLWKAIGLLGRGWLLGLSGRTLDAGHVTASAVSAYRATGATLNVPFSLANLAGGYAELGQIDEAWRCIDEAISMIEITKERWSEAEANRIAGEIALMSSVPERAKAQMYFERALSVARQQQAKSWELRAAMSLARLWRDQSKVREARELLAPVYGWFTEGFDTLDLQEAKALLAQLAS
jgi:predicted ATPase